MTEQAKKAWEVIKQNELASVSLVCRKLDINFNEAIKLIDELESLGYISEFKGNQPREILK